MSNLVRLVFLLILINFLESCKTATDINRYLYVEQCSPNFILDFYKEIDEEKSFCLCRTYKYSLNYMGGVENTAIYKPIIYCNKIVGNPTREYLNVVNFLGDIQKEIQDHVYEETK